MKGAEKCRLLNSRQGLHKEGHQYQHISINNNETDLLHESDLDSNSEADNNDRTRCCCGLQTGLYLIYGVTLQPLITCLKTQRNPQINSHLEDNNIIRNQSSENYQRINCNEVREGGKEYNIGIGVLGKGTFNPPRSKNERKPLSPNIVDNNMNIGKTNEGILPTVDNNNNNNFFKEQSSNNNHIPLETLNLTGSRSLRTGIKQLNSPLYNSDNSITLFNILRTIENERIPLRTLEQLTTVLERTSEYLPVRIEVEKERHHKNEISSSLILSSICYISLEILGPVRAVPNAPVLGLLEDIILEDCVIDSLRITSIHFADIVFSGDATSGVQGTTRVESNSYLDALPSLGFSSDAISKFSTTKTENMMKECCDRICAFAKNILEYNNFAETIHLTRCSFTPSELGRGLRLPITRLKRLLFEKCPLSAAHLDAFVRLVKAENRRNNEIRALQNLIELQLSGSLTEESIYALLSYFYDDLLETEVSLTILRLPSIWVGMTRSHPLLERHPRIEVRGT